MHKIVAVYIIGVLVVGGAHLAKEFSSNLKAEFALFLQPLSLKYHFLNNNEIIIIPH